MRAAEAKAKGVRPLYVKLSLEDWFLLDGLTVAQTVKAGRVVRVADVLRGLIRTAAKKSK
jgi:hypothetical protein